MAINGVGTYNYRWNNNYSKANGVAGNDSDKKTGNVADKAASASEETKAAETAVQSTETTAAATAKKSETYKPDMDKVNQMKADLKNNMGSFKQMVYAMFKGQSGFAGDSMKALLNIDKDTQASAQAAISDDGEWGIEATANRILDFAKALSGGDPSKIETLKDAVTKGFKAAEKVWGGKLPDISYKTLQKVMDGFDEWAKNGANGAAETQA